MMSTLKSVASQTKGKGKHNHHNEREGQNLVQQNSAPSLNPQVFGGNQSRGRDHSR
jgi:hypothetical protein